MVNTLVSRSTSKRHISCVSLLNMVGGTVYKTTNSSLTNIKLLGLCEEVVWNLMDFYHSRNLFKKFLIKVAITYI